MFRLSLFYVAVLVDKGYSNIFRFLFPLLPLVIYFCMGGGDLETTVGFVNYTCMYFCEHLRSQQRKDPREKKKEKKKQ